MKVFLLLFLILSCKEKPEPTKPSPVSDNPIKKFHLNYKPEKDWSKCKTSDYVIFDMFDTSKEDFQKCHSMGAKMFCYFSSQYESWRPDSHSFGALSSKLDNWQGERWVVPSDSKNLIVMVNRLYLAKEKCDGVDIDNIDRPGHEEYILNIFKTAKMMGLMVSQKNAIEKIEYFRPWVDVYQNEECQKYNECDFYEKVGKPVFNIEYGSCKKINGMYSVKKDVIKMDKEEHECK